MEFVEQKRDTGRKRPAVKFVIPEAFAVFRDEDGNRKEGIIKNKPTKFEVTDLSEDKLYHLDQLRRKGYKFVGCEGMPPKWQATIEEALGAPIPDPNAKPTKKALKSE